MSDFNVNDRPGLDDPVWDFVILERIKKYVPFVRRWWGEYAGLYFQETGTSELYADEVAGLYVRFTRTAHRSPIKGVQAFPFVPTGRLQITGAEGGSTKMVERCCLGGRLKIDEFTIVCKSNLPSTFNASQFLAFVPTDFLTDTHMKIGQWLYMKPEELRLLVAGIIPDSVKLKAVLKL